MGVLNTTPDSFSDGGQYDTTQAAIERGREIMDEGADILDIGGESTRPGAAPVESATEQARVIPVIEALAGDAGKRGIWLSIDTRNAATMRAALDAGVTMINDVSALTYDPEAMEVAADSDVPVCLMHMAGTPQDMQARAVYDDVVGEIYSYLEHRIDSCRAAGIARKRLVADPGIGFGKTLDHNLALLRNLHAFHDLAVPVLLGASRKSFIPKICGQVNDAQDRLPGSLAAVMEGYHAGVQIFRVHDVWQTRQALDIVVAIHNHHSANQAA
jgi:dihydropteroate synthase